jgi:hypothetical protein
VRDGSAQRCAPFQDLEDPPGVSGCATLRAPGHYLTVPTLDVEHGRARDVVLQHADLVDVWRIVRLSSEREEALQRVSGNGE